MRFATPVASPYDPTATTRAPASLARPRPDRSFERDPDGIASVIDLHDGSLDTGLDGFADPGAGRLGDPGHLADGRSTERQRHPQVDDGATRFTDLDPERLGWRIVGGGVGLGQA